jgi:hypothetical protein
MLLIILSTSIPTMVNKLMDIINIGWYIKEICYVLFVSVFSILNEKHRYLLEKLLTICCQKNVAVYVVAISAYIKINKGAFTTGKNNNNK